MGLKAAYALLRVVTSFYLFFSPASNRSLIRFYTRAGLTKPAKWTHRYRNFNLFGQALVDKIATYAGYGSALTFDFENEDELRRLAANGKGALLIGAHLGNWEIASQLMHRINARVYVLMLENEHARIKELIESVTDERSFEVIPLTDDISMIIKIKTALDAGGIICMHADRYLNRSRTLELDFLGDKMLFPEGPFVLAAKLQVPVSFVYAIKTDTTHYDFSCTTGMLNEPAPKIAAAYVALLERMARKYPHQWYNFYDYWGDDIARE